MRFLLYSMVVCLLTSTFVSAGQINSFIYHRFDDARYPSTNISVEVFVQQLEFLRARGIPAVSTQEISELVARGEALPERGVMITVDDSHRSFYEAGMPVVRKYNVPVSLFVNTDSVGTPGYMTWDEIRGVAAEGVVIGNHTSTHDYLVEKRQGESFSQWRERIYNDINKAQQKFKRELGFAPNIFAYPYGEYSADIVEIVKELGFIAAFSQHSGVISPQSDPFTLPRFPMGGVFATLAEFQSKAVMKPLIVGEQHPFDPVIYDGSKAPVLDLYFPGVTGGAGQFNCFAQGGNRCTVRANQDRGPGWYQVTGDSPLKGRRNKYTLTRQAPGGGWQWFSQLWINADNPPRR